MVCLGNIRINTLHKGDDDDDDDNDNNNNNDNDNDNNNNNLTPVYYSAGSTAQMRITKSAQTY